MLEPLSRVELLEKEHVKDGYREFWLSPAHDYSHEALNYADAGEFCFRAHFRVSRSRSPLTRVYRRGLAEPHLDEAAEVVARVIAAEDASSRRMLRASGSVCAREHLWAVHHALKHQHGCESIQSKNQTNQKIK